MAHIPEELVQLLDFSSIHENLLALYNFTADVSSTYLSENIPPSIYEKLILILHFVTSFFTYLHDKFLPFIHEMVKLIFPLITGTLTYLYDKFMPYIRQIVNILFPFVIGMLTDLYNKLLPYIHGMVNHFLPFVTGVFKYLSHNGWTVVLPVALIAFMFHCCCGCLDRGGKMMKAPGRGGARMRRNAFEANPRGYFRNLRDK